MYLRFILRHEKNIIILRRRRRYVQTSSANNDTYCSGICRFVAVFLLSSLSIISVIVNVVLSTAMVVCAGPTWRRKKKGNLRPGRALRKEWCTHAVPKSFVRSITRAVTTAKSSNKNRVTQPMRFSFVRTSKGNVTIYCKFVQALSVERGHVWGYDVTRVV